MFTPKGVNWRLLILHAVVTLVRFSSMKLFELEPIFEPYTLFSRRVYILLIPFCVRVGDTSRLLILSNHVCLV